MVRSPRPAPHDDSARRPDERGQVLSSLVAVVAVVAVVAGLLVLFGTGGSGGSGTPVADEPPVTTPAASGAPGTPSTTTTVPPSAARTTEPTSAPTTAPTVPTPEPTTRPVPTATPTTTARRSTRPPVEIYNNTVRRGLAERVAGKARTAGWTVRGADNWRGKVVGSTVYHPTGMQAQAAALAADLGITRVKERLDNMKKDRLTVILTSDYRG